MRLAAATVPTVAAAARCGAAGEARGEDLTCVSLTRPAWRGVLVTAVASGGTGGPWPGAPSIAVGAKLSASLENLAGPGGGVVELPVDLAWSGERSFDLADPVQRYLYHVTVLTSAVTREHYTSWLNAGLLRGDWSRLRLPRPLREIWQEHFPELGPG